MKNIFFAFLSFLGFNKFSANADLACADNLTLPAISACDDTLYSYPAGLFIAKAGQGITAVGAIPTAAEISTAMGLATAAKVLAIQPLHEGEFVPETKTIQGPNDMPEKISETMTINAKLRYLNDTTIDKLRELAIHKTVQVWPLDIRGRLYGAKAGYTANIIYNTLPAKGFGHSTKAEISIQVSWMIDPIKTFATAQDVAYLALQNA